MTAVQAAAILFAIVCLGVIAFQLALAAGAPLGAYAMGGANPGRLRTTMRVGAAGQALVLAGLGVIVLSDAGLVWPALADSLPSLIWIAVGFSALSVVLNALTRSTMERRIWLPVAVLLLVSSGVVALS
jgi:hypothetical protein